MTCEEVMTKLESLGDEKIRKQYSKLEGGDNLFGVKSADLRGIAKEIKSDPDMAAALWKTGNVDAMMLATMIMKPKSISTGELEQMVSSTTNTRVADWLNTNVTKLHPQKEELRQKWMATDDMMSARTGWSLTTERVVKNPDGLDLNALLDRIEAEMGPAPEPLQWMMNYCLAEIGINFPEHRERAIAIGEKIGAFRNYPVSKGCTSPFAPIWISAMVARQ
jgi:3-methyladenine DNA glycosylase AlkD